MGQVKNRQGVLLLLTFRQVRASMEDSLGDHVPTPWVPLHIAVVSSVALGHSTKTIPEKGHPFSF